MLDLFIVKDVRGRDAGLAAARGPVVADLVDRFQAPLCRYAYLLCGDAAEAEDLVQEVFARLLTGECEPAEIHHPVSYLQRSVTNLFLERGRRSSLWTRRVSGLFARSSVDDLADAAATRDQVRRGLRLLSERQRAVIVLRYYLDLGYEEIGQVLGCPATTARSLTMRALKRMRVSLRPVEEGAEDDHRG